MRTSIFVALAVAPFALAQFGLGDDGSAFGGDGDSAVAACTTGDNAGCSAYITSANNCYRISEAESEEDAIACACDPDFLASFKTCAACVYDAAGADSTESKIVDDYAAQFTEYCNEAVTVDNTISASSSAAGSLTSTAAPDSSSSMSSAASSSSFSSAGAQANATATTEVIGASPTGAGDREAVGVAGMVGMLVSAMILLA